MKRKSFVDVILLLVVLAISLSAGAQEFDLKVYKTTKTVRDGKEYIAIKADFIYHDQFPELQKYISRHLFKEENTSIEEAFNNYLKTFEEANRGNFTKGQTDVFVAKYQGDYNGIFQNYYVGYERKRFNAKEESMTTKRSYRNFVYDIKKNRVLTLQDIFKPAKVEELKTLIGKSKVQMIMDKEQLTIGYKETNQTKEHKFSYATDKDVFNDDFMQFIVTEKPQENNCVDSFTIANSIMQEDKAFDVVEQMPQFDGGETALKKYLRKNIKYPTSAEDNGIQGRVVTTFVVERDGSITDVKVIKSVDPSLDEEAVRVIKSMPKWNPGKQNGITQRVKYILPVPFRLDD